MEIKKYRLVAYLRVEPEKSELLTYDEALAEKEQQEFLFPENIYRIEEVKSALPTDGKEDSCIPHESRKS